MILSVSTSSFHDEFDIVRIGLTPYGWTSMFCSFGHLAEEGNSQIRMIQQISAHIEQSMKKIFFREPCLLCQLMHHVQDRSKCQNKRQDPTWILSIASIFLLPIWSCHVKKKKSIGRGVAWYQDTFLQPAESKYSSQTIARLIHYNNAWVLHDTSRKIPVGLTQLF